MGKKHLCKFRKYRESHMGENQVGKCQDMYNQVDKIKDNDKY